MTDRRTVDTINDDQLSQLYDNLERAETENAELRDALAHCHEREPRQRAEAAIERVTDLQAQWLAAGPPPLGVPLARWWDARLVELHAAIHAPTAASCSPDAPETEPNNPRTTLDNPATSNDPHIYLSTGCYHNDHAYCQAMTGLNGAKRPASCKFCHAACQCPCHQQTAPPAHVGGGANAEDCPACTGTNPDYPFICPGPDEAAADDLGQPKEG